MNCSLEDTNVDGQISDPTKIYCDVYKKKLSELYYSLVIGEKKDMLIGAEGDITFFEIRVVARKFIWDPVTKNFRKVVANPRGKNIKKFNRSKNNIDNEISSENLKEEEFVS